MFIKCLRRYLPCVALLWALSAGAAGISGLYSAQLGVAEIDAQPTPGQITAGLGLVLIKLSGRSDVMYLAGYDEIMAQAPGLLREHRYLVGADGSKQLQLDYDEHRLDALLQEKGISNPEQRPALLLWLVLNQAGEPEEYIPGDHEAAQALNAQAQRRGLVVQRPLQDLQDWQQLSPEALWQLAPDQVWRASRRYGPEAVLAGRDWAEAGYWFSEFEIFEVQPSGTSLSDVHQSGADSGSQHYIPEGDLAGQMTEIVDRVADQLLGKVAAGSLDYRSVVRVLQIEGISGQADYLALIDSLRQSGGVMAVFPERLSQGDLQLRIQLQISAGQLQDALKRDNRLAPGRREDDAGDAGVLHYRWQG